MAFLSYLLKRMLRIICK